MDRKTVMLIVLPVVAVLVLGVGGYQAWLRTAPPMPETVDDVDALLNSARYARLSNAAKRPYQERMNEMWGGLSDEDKKRLGEYLKDNDQAREEAFEQGIRTMYTTMVLQQDETARNAMLDLIINQMEARGGMGNRADSATPEQQEQARQQMFNWIDKGDPQAQAYGSEFMKLIQNRRKERGLPPL